MIKPRCTFLLDQLLVTRCSRLARSMEGSWVCYRGNSCMDTSVCAKIITQFIKHAIQPYTTLHTHKQETDGTTKKLTLVISERRIETNTGETA